MLAFLTAIRNRLWPTKQDPKLEAARRSKRLREAVYGDQLHEYRILRREDLPEHDHYFLEQRQSILEANGFRLLGDVENVTLSRVAGGNRSFTRTFASADSSLVVGVRHMKSRRPGTRDHYTIEFQTEFSDGTFLLTNNTGVKPISRSQDGVTCIFYPRDTPVEELLRIHNEAAAGRRTAEPSLKTTLVSSADDYIHFSRRLHGNISRRQQAKGFVKEEPRELAARTIFEQLKALYASGDHQWRITSPTDFPSLDQGFYDRTRDALASHSYRFLFDRENMTLTRVHPHWRTFIRTMVSTDGTILGHACHLRNFSPEIRATGFETECSNGVFLTTETGIGMLPAFPGVEVKRCPPTTTLDELLQIHRNRLDEYLRANPGVSLRRIQTADDAVQFVDRQHRLKARHKLSIGLINEEDLKRIRGRQLSPGDQAVLAEIEKLKQASHNDRQ